MKNQSSLNKIRKRIFEIIEVGSEQDKVSRIYDYFMMLTIIISIIPLLTHKNTPVFSVIDKITVFIFILDYVFRFITADLKLERGAISFFLYPFSFIALIDLLSILPSLTILAKGYRLLKIFRLFRSFKVFRVFKIGKKILQCIINDIFCRNCKRCRFCFLLILSLF